MQTSLKEIVIVSESGKPNQLIRELRRSGDALVSVFPEVVKFTVDWTIKILDWYVGRLLGRGFWLWRPIYAELFPNDPGGEKTNTYNVLINKSYWTEEEGRKVLDVVKNLGYRTGKIYLVDDIRPSVYYLHLIDKRYDWDRGFVGFAKSFDRAMS